MPSRHLGVVFRQLAAQKDSDSLHGQLKPDHGHLIRHSAKACGGGSRRLRQGREWGSSASDRQAAKRNFVGQHLCARGYFASTVGRDETVICDDSRNKEKEHARLEPMCLWR